MAYRSSRVQHELRFVNVRFLLIEMTDFGRLMPEPVYGFLALESSVKNLA